MLLCSFIYWTGGALCDREQKQWATVTPSSFGKMCWHFCTCFKKWRVWKFKMPAVWYGNWKGLDGSEEIFSHINNKIQIYTGESVSLLFIILAQHNYSTCFANTFRCLLSNNDTAKEIYFGILVVVLDINFKVSILIRLFWEKVEKIREKAGYI